MQHHIAEARSIFSNFQYVQWRNCALADEMEDSCEEAGHFWLDHLRRRESSLDLRILREGQSTADRLALSYALVDCRLFTKHPIRDWDVPRFRKHDSHVLAVP